MTKYIDAEQLSEKIESISLYAQKSADYNDGRNDMKMMVLDLIDSLQKEQPEVDLEKEILNWIGDEGSCKYGKWTWYECNKMIRHFYELGRLNARKEG